LFKLAKRPTRLNSELVDQDAASLLVGLERRRLPARAIERERELLAQPLPERMLGDEPVELCCDRCVLTAFQVGLDALLVRGKAELLEASDLVLGEGVVGQVTER